MTHEKNPNDHLLAMGHGENGNNQNKKKVKKVLKAHAIQRKKKNENNTDAINDNKKK